MYVEEPEIQGVQNSKTSKIGGPRQYFISFWSVRISLYQVNVQNVSCICGTTLTSFNSESFQAQLLLLHMNSTFFFPFFFSFLSPPPPPRGSNSNKIGRADRTRLSSSPFWISCLHRNFFMSTDILFYACCSHRGRKKRWALMLGKVWFLV